MKIVKLINRTIRQHHPLSKEIDRRVKLSSVTKRSAVSNKNRYCYFRIPKSASSTVIRTLAYYDPCIKYDPKDKRGSKAKKSFSGLRSARALTINGFSKKYFLFTFVRNPYSRLLSAYKSKVVMNDNSNYDPARKFILSRSEKDKLTFEGFIDYLESGGLFHDPHWTPQTSMIPVNPLRLDYLGRVESIEDDLKNIIDRLFGEGTYRGSSTRKAGRTDSASGIKKYYTNQLAERVRGLYKEDFENFGYGDDLP